MKTEIYKNFSRKIHNKIAKNRSPNSCQFELTFGCSLRCRHCYCECYNKKEYLDQELDTAKIKYILDEVRRTGTLWLCLTGGDPLTRQDFPDIYSYARKKGFIVSVFTSGYTMTRETADYFKRHAPFTIEITLNGVTPRTYEDISQVEGSFRRVMEGLDLMLKAGLPLKIKTQVTKQNVGEAPQIKKFVEGLGLKFRPDYLLNAGLDGNNAPCSLRIPPRAVLALTGVKPLAHDDCMRLRSKPVTGFFPCVVPGGGGVIIDPFGNIIPCLCIREPRINLLETGFEAARKRSVAWLKAADFSADAKCKYCPLIDFCDRCPGKARLEMGDSGKPIPYFCEMAQMRAGILKTQEAQVPCIAAKR